MTNPSQMEKYLTRALAYGAFALIASQLNEKISIKNGCVYSVLTSTVVLLEPLLMERLLS